MELHEKMPRLARRLGGDLYGVADLTLARAAVMEQGASMWMSIPARCPSTSG